MATKSINTFINKLYDVAIAHPQIEGYGFGPRYEMVGDIVYPLLWIETDTSHTIEYAEHNSYSSIVYEFTLRVSDLVNNQNNVYNVKGENSNNGQEVTSDTFAILLDVVNYIRSSVFFSEFKIQNDISVEPFFHEDDNDANGHSATIFIKVINDSQCDNPLTDGGTLIGGTVITTPSEGTTLNELTDVSLTSISSNQFLIYDGQFWVNRTINLEDLNDVDTTNTNIGQGIKWDGTNWISATFSSVINELNEITNVNTNPLDGQFLQWNNTDGEWISATVSVSTNYDTNLGTQAMLEDVGGIVAGTTANDLNGLSYNTLWDSLLFPTVLATITQNASVTLTISGTTGNVEVGTTLNNTLTATFNDGTITDGDGVTTHPLVGGATLYTFTGQGISSTAQVGNTLGINITAVEGDNDHDVVVAYSEGTETYYDNKSNAGTNLDASRVAGSVSDTNASPNITGYYRLFYSTGGSTPTTSAQVRAYSNEFDSDNSFTLNTGSTDTKFIIVLPPGRTISSVVDLDALSAVITSSYVLQGTISVDDAGATARTYNLYEMNIGAAYSSSHRHSMSFSG